jgi:predicted HTH transcriptional regulator
MEKFPSALKLQSVPEDENLWLIENYEEFLAKRRKMLAEELNNFLSNITITQETTSEVSIEDMIEEGESNELEFKSSLRWSYQAESVDKKLESVILKSISAFSNGEGGTLIMGVDDDGKVLGLDHDYTSLNGDKDEFELHLRNLVNDAFGKNFATSAITIKFYQINEMEFCKVVIKKGDKPLYLKVVDGNGNKTEKFYVRSGNASQELGISDITEYITSRFK